MMTLMLHKNNCSFSFSGILFGLFHATLLFGYIIHVCNPLHIYRAGNRSTSGVDTGERGSEQRTGHSMMESRCCCPLACIPARCGREHFGQESPNFCSEGLNKITCDHLWIPAQYLVKFTFLEHKICFKNFFELRISPKISFNYR